MMKWLYDWIDFHPFTFIMVSTLLLGTFLFGGLTIEHYSQDELPDATEYPLLVKSMAGEYLAQEFGFADGFVVIDNYYTVESLLWFEDRGDYHEGTILLDGDFVSIEKRGDD